MGLLSNILGGGDLIKEIGSTVRQVLPNDQAKRDFDLKIAELADKADQRETELIDGQIEVNKEQAKSANLFVAGARPFVMWVCGIGLGVEFLIRPFGVAFGLEHFPHIDSDLMLLILGPLLGLGGLRTFEKMRGVATSVNGTVPTPVKPVEVQPQVTPIQEKPKTATSRWLR